MMRFVVVPLVALSVLSQFLRQPRRAMAACRGYVKDEQGGVLPGVTVTAPVRRCLRRSSAVTDVDGYYRLINLPPGTFAFDGRAGRLLDATGAKGS